jgi:hypothetical protein
MTATESGAPLPISQRLAEKGGEILDHYALSQEEQYRRRQIAEQARQMILQHLPVEDQDETSLTTYYREYYMQISFSSLHPLVVICLAKSIPNPDSTKKRQMVNRLNLNSVLGSHAINQEVGCYSYRSTHWLDTELTAERFFEMLDRCADEADRGYIRLKAS